MAPPPMPPQPTPSWLPPPRAPFDFIAYFRRHPLFESGWAQYRNKGEIDGCQLFVREE